MFITAFFKTNKQLLEEKYAINESDKSADEKQTSWGLTTMALVVRVALKIASLAK